MRYRVMRVIVFFDLPTLTSDQRRAYRLFRKGLLKEGFLMIQESVYVRICVNRQSARFLEDRVAAMVPHDGVVQSLIVTEKQYAEIRFLSGTYIHDPRNSDERTLVI